MKPTLPPHIAWPLFIIFILAVGIGGAFSILFAANSDGGVQVVEDYYRQAVAWDSTAAVRARADALGWRADLNVYVSGEPLQTIEFTVVDSTGSAVLGLRGTVRLSRPQHAKPVAEIPFYAAGEPGTYRVKAPLAASGLWDFGIEARNDSADFVVTIRRLVER
ncbi:MAG: FixH family protein [Rhodothermales bacterium]